MDPGPQPTPSPCLPPPQPGGTIRRTALHTLRLPTADDKFADKDKDEDDEDEVSEKLNLDVIDDENLTEAVLKRVVERLLRHRRK